MSRLLYTPEGPGAGASRGGSKDIPPEQGDPRYVPGRLHITPFAPPPGVLEFTGGEGDVPSQGFVHDQYNPPPFDNLYYGFRDVTDMKPEEGEDVPWGHEGPFLYSPGPYDRASVPITGSEHTPHDDLGSGMPEGYESWEDFFNQYLEASGRGGDQNYNYLHNGESPYDDDYADWAEGVYDFLRTGGGPADFMEAWQPYREIMEGQIDRGASDLVEKFGNMGAQYGTGAIEGVGAFIQSGEAQINNTLGQLAYQSESDNLDRQLQGMQQLAEYLYGSEEAYADRYGSMQDLLPQLFQMEPQQQMMLQQLAGAFQANEQGVLNFDYQEFLRTYQGMMPELFQFLGTPGSQFGNEQYQAGAVDTWAPIAASLIGAMIMASSKEWKTEFNEVDTDKVLDKLAKLPIKQWKYKSDPKNAHLGPMAEDFHKAFGLGPSGKFIFPIDATGVLIASMQALVKRVEELERQVSHG